MVVVLLPLAKALFQTATASRDNVELRREGDRTVKVYEFITFKRAEKPNSVVRRLVEFSIKAGEAITPPMKRYKDIQIDFEPVERGLFTTRMRVTVRNPVEPRRKIGKIFR